MLSQSLAEAIDQGTEFLMSARSEDGLWRDFQTLAGLSSEWVTAFVAYVLSQVNSNSSISSTLVCLAQRQRVNGGWAYNEDVPTDCDSTAWSVLALSSAAQCDSTIIARGVEYIQKHQSVAEGGFCTYSASDHIETYIQKPDLTSVQGWTQPHPCVTALALQALLTQREHIESHCIENAIRYLQGKKEQSGIWRSYWWSGCAYGTYHAIRALSAAQAVTARDLTESARQLERQWSTHAESAASSHEKIAAFEAAFTILAQVLCADIESLTTADKLTSQLIAEQNSDGSWPSSPILRIPPPVVTKPEMLKRWRQGTGTGVIIPDQRRCFTTAAVLWALAAYRSSCCASQELHRPVFSSLSIGHKSGDPTRF
jgi:hypothetical protein